ncbi:MAG: N-acetylglutamate synthase-like GNAT family acetyltransferase [Alphaproteobacteria bacterium]
MEILSKRNFVLYTEEQLKKCEADFSFDVANHEWTMWLELTPFKLNTSTNLTLQPILSAQDWVELFYIRKIIEKEFCVEDEALIQSFVDDIKIKSTKLNGTWFLAQKYGQTIGAIGLVPFKYNGVIVGRLQDVDISPEFQGKGYGNDILSSLCCYARKENYSALCLMAKSNDWPKDWYSNFGFVKLGET